MKTLLKKIQLYFIACISTALRVIARVFLSVLYTGKKRVVPPITDAILLKSAVSLASDIRERRVKSEDIIKSYRARIEEVNPYINAVADARFEDAIKEAQEADELIASGTKTPQQLKEEKPLLGVPFTVKLMISAKGMPCNLGSLYHKDAILDADSDVVALMKNAGAIVLATTNCPDFSLHFETYNKIYGRTSNPYDTTKTSGGSSGGEGALLGSGGSLIGIGNDLAGSIRHPSNFNGIFGHKPSSELVSNDGLYMAIPPNLNSMLSTGPMCRYAEDLVLMMKLLSNPEGNRIDFDKPVDFSKLKIYYMLDDGSPISQGVSQEIKDAMFKAMEYFRSTYGTEIKQMAVPEMSNAFRLYLHVLIMINRQHVRNAMTMEKFELHPKRELLKALFGQSKLTLFPLISINLELLPFSYNKKNSSKILKSLQKLQQELNLYLNDEYSVLFLPSFTTTAHYHYGFIPLLPSISYMAIFNMLGLPVTQCPMGLGKDQLPLGFQVATANRQDPLSLACALEIEKAFGGWVPPNTHKNTKTPPCSQQE